MAAEERQHQRLQREAELCRMRLELAVQHMAACERAVAGAANAALACLRVPLTPTPCLAPPCAGRIARAWRRFLLHPARLRKVEAAVCIQAAWRGWTSCRRSAILMQQRRLLACLQSAVAAGELQHAQQAAQQLAALGLGAQASQLLAALEEQAGQACNALRDAAAGGTADQFQATQAAAARFAHLEPEQAAAAAQFAARAAAAEETVRQAVESGTLSQLSSAAAAAAALGVSSASLQEAQRRMMARNQTASVALQAAVESSPFCPDTFAACLQAAERYGLHAEAARAQQGLQLRQSQAAAHLQRVAADGGAAEVEVACMEADSLGLEGQADVAEAQLRRRQGVATDELRQAAHSGSLQQYEAAAAQAALLRVSSSMQQVCAEQMRLRQQEAELQLQHAAEQGEPAEVRQRCQEAMALGLGRAVEVAEQRLRSRKLEAERQMGATRIQAAWHGWRARLLRQRLEDDRCRQAAAATRIQAAWRGWACRHCSHHDVCQRLALWRCRRCEARQLQQQRAATCIQASCSVAGRAALQHCRGLPT